ncbi:MAG: hypothetical protein IJ137_11180 [Eubacterium sp.]|nr:hypothetical protein [Eubacterium sp.]
MIYSKGDIKKMEEYEAAVDPEVSDFVRGVLQGDDKLSYITVAFMPKPASIIIERLTGKKVEGSRVILDINAIKHINNRHGAQGKQDHSMKSIDDLARIGYVIMNFDEITYEGITTTGYLDEKGDPSPMIRIAKRIDGIYYVVGAVNSSKKKRIYIVTAYIARKRE